MKLYLVRHGEAVPKDVDPDAPLSEQGQADVMRIGAFLSNAGVRVSRITHSGKTRARQTAEILGGALEGTTVIDSGAGLGPKDPVEPWAAGFDERSGDTMLVGHMPFMGRLVSRLVAGDEHAELVRFRPGTVVCLEQDGSSGWIVSWVLGPELVAALGDQ